MLRILFGCQTMGKATLLEQMQPCAGLSRPFAELLQHRLASRKSDNAYYWITPAGVVLASTCNAPSIAAPARTSITAGVYDGADLRRHSVRPGAYTALDLPSRGIGANRPEP